MSPITYLDFENVSYTSLSRLFLSHFAATSRRAQNRFIMLILKFTINAVAKLAAELLRTLTSAARANSFILIVIDSRAR